MKIVLFGYYGFGNTGDEAILQAIIKTLRKLESTIQITVLSNNPAQTKQDFQVDAVNRWNFFQIKRAIKLADGVISGGGSLFQDITSKKSLLYYLFILKLAHYYGKPTFIYAQGMGPFKSFMSKKLIRHTLQKVNQITVRDLDSKNTLHQLGIRQQIIIVPDPAFGLDILPRQASTLEKQKYLLVALRPWGTKQSHLKKLAVCLDELAKDGLLIVFISMQEPRDSQIARTTIRFMKEKNYLLKSALSLQEKITLFQNAELVIGVRLHALIFASITNVPFIALSYDPKIDALANQFNMPIISNFASGEWSQTHFLKQSKQLLNNKNQHQMQLTEKYHYYQKQALKTAELALRTIARDTN